jgi:hypothetical protein
MGRTITTYKANISYKMKQQFLNCMCSIMNSLQTAAEWGQKNGLWFVATWSCTVRMILMWYFTDVNLQLHVPEFYPQGESPASMVDPRQFYPLSPRAKSGLPIPGPSHHTDSARSNFTIKISILYFKKPQIKPHSPKKKTLLPDSASYSRRCRRYSSLWGSCHFTNQVRAI